MAGERSETGAPPARTGISAARADPGARRQGHAADLPGALVARVLDRHERPFPHVAEKNTAAIALHERLGFTGRKHVAFRGSLVP
ncbi:GNAT family N-acetyltransferase [Streptomyces globisporus]|uniref:GNAT family N-acetyltransferase n=1 Tax=Streptomyces globisporus TaxID=1908 RepID=UPI00068FDFF5|nr:GNAT family N-acetyltransferase [Streptomyces globisporus]